LVLRDPCFRNACERLGTTLRAGRWCETKLECKKNTNTHVIRQSHKLPLRTGVCVQVITPSTTRILAHETDVLLRCVWRTVEDLPSCSGRNVGNRVDRAPLDKQEISWAFKGGEWKERKKDNARSLENQMQTPECLEWTIHTFHRSTVWSSRSLHWQRRGRMRERAQ
jgi:hypothetical protein